MKFLKSKIVKILLIFVIVIFISFFSIDKKIYNDFISAKISNYIKQSGLPILVDSPKFFFFGIKSDNISANVPISNILILLRFTDCTVTPDLMSLFSNTQKVSFNASAYNGKIEGKIDYNPNENTTSSVNINNVNVSVHPQLASVGVKGGILNVKITNLKNTVSRNIPIGGDIDFKLDDLSIPLTSSLIKKIIPLDFKKDLKDVSIDLNVQFNDSKILVNSLHLESNFFKVDGSGELSLIALHSNIIKGTSLNLNVVMTEHFTKVLSPSLIIPALVASSHRVNGKLDENTKAFSAQISGPLSQLFINIKDTSSNLLGVDK